MNSTVFDEPDQQDIPSKLAHPPTFLAKYPSTDNVFENFNSALIFREKLPCVFLLKFSNLFGFSQTDSVNCTYSRQGNFKVEGILTTWKESFRIALEERTDFYQVALSDIPTKTADVSLH